VKLNTSEKFSLPIKGLVIPPEYRENTKLKCSKISTFQNCEIKMTARITCSLPPTPLKLQPNGAIQIYCYYYYYYYAAKITCFMVYHQQNTLDCTTITQTKWKSFLWCLCWK